MPRIRRGFPVIRPGTARLHPKGTSSRFARRAPRRLAPHNDTSGGAAVHQRPPAVELSRTWRSGSAATVKSVSTHVRRCPVHLGRPLLRLPRRFAPRNDKSGAITVLTGACTSRQRCAGSGMPLPYNKGTIDSAPQKSKRSRPVGGSSPARISGQGFFWISSPQSDSASE